MIAGAYQHSKAPLCGAYKLLTVEIQQYVSVNNISIHSYTQYTVTVTSNKIHMKSDYSLNHEWINDMARHARRLCM